MGIGSEASGNELVASLSKKDLKLVRYMLENHVTKLRTSDIASLFMVTTRSARTWCKEWVENGLLESTQANKRVITYALAEPYASLRLAQLGFAE